MTDDRTGARLALALVLGSVVTLLPGCVERAFWVKSEPPGANVYIDGAPQGTTPVRIPFEHYGTREVMVRMEETPEMRGERALAPQTRMVELSTPWWQWFPIDLVSEFAWPGTIRDERTLMFTLEPHDAETLGEEFRESVRAAGLRLPRDPDPEPADGEDAGGDEGDDDPSGSRE